MLARVPAVSTQPSGSERLVAVDSLRGLVIALMALDHAQNAFNPQHFHADSVFLWQAGSALPPAAFLTRWVTHLCAPTFLFLLGVGTAFAAGRREKGAFDRHLVQRGGLLMLLDPLWMWWGFGGGDHIPPIGCGVLFALGASLVALRWLRQLRVRTLVAGALGFVLLAEAITGGAFALEGMLVAGPGRLPSAPTALLLSGGPVAGGRAMILYPLLPWITLAVLGFGFGKALHGRTPAQAARLSLRLGLAALALFVLVRALDGYGNMLLHRDSLAPLQWLHVSKYPPSLTFVTLELGLALCLLAGFCHRPVALLATFGRASLAFYLLHVHLLTGTALLLGLWQRQGLLAGYLGALAVLAALYPVCRWFIGYKRQHPAGWARYF